MPSIIQIDSAPNSVLSHPLRIGDNALTLMLGPCAVESYEQTRAIAAAVSRAGVRVLRGGAYDSILYNVGAYFREGAEMTHRSDSYGFRVVRDVAPE